MRTSRLMSTAVFLLCAWPFTSQAFSASTTPAQTLFSKAPQYPEQAVELGLEGVVMLLLEIKKSGQLTNIQVANEDVHPLLQKAAIKTVKQWRFEAATRDGKKVRSTVKVPIRFELLADRIRDSSVTNQAPFKSLN